MPDASNPSALPRIRRLSRLLSWCCLAAAVLLPSAVAWHWMTVPAEALAVQLGLPARTADGGLLLDLDGASRAVGLVLTLVPAGLMVAALASARRCFGLFAAGELFTPGTVAALRGFAAGCFASALAGLLLPTVLTVLLTLGNPPGQRHLAVSLGSGQLFVLLVAGLVWVMARVMAEAVALREENAQFV
jgi:hypothetical protein